MKTKLIPALLILLFAIVAHSQSIDAPIPMDESNGNKLNQMERPEGEGDQQNRQSMEENPDLKNHKDLPITEEVYPEEYDEEEEW